MLTFEQLRAASPVKDADYARRMIASTAKGTPDRAARLKLAEMAAGRFGNYTPEAKALWAEYHAAGAPAA